MAGILVSRKAEIPDLLRISRYRKAPELGPRLLFFSGGSALSQLSRSLKGYTHNSTHLVTPFDSGGSSAELRKAFNMPSIGDLRSRLMALADESVLGHPEIFELFGHRFPKTASNAALRQRLEAMAQGKSELLSDIKNPMRRLICHQLGYFLDAMPAHFDLRGASIGNLILCGGYLNNHRQLEPSIFLFEKLVNVQGTVRAVVDDNVHLCADLENGECILGQHLLTGKEVPAIQSPIRRLYLRRNATDKTPVKVELKKKNRKLIKQADLICYPPGSFYTSLMANLLPEGVGSAIAANDCPKVYIPNLGDDPEQVGMSIENAIDKLLARLHEDAGENCATGKLLNFVLVDQQHGKYRSDINDRHLRKLGITLINAKLVSQRSAPYYDSDLLASALLSLT